MFSPLNADFEAKLAIDDVVPIFSKAPELANQLQELLRLIFLKWKLERGNRKPSWWTGGLLGVEFDFERAKPYQCADVPISGYAGLALTLLSEKYKPLVELSEKLPGINFLLAGAVLVEAHDDPINADSLRESVRIYKDYCLADNKIMLNLITPLALKGNSFSSGRRKGAINDKNRYLFELSSRYPNRTAKELYRVACEEAENGASQFQYDRYDGGMLLDGNTEVDLQKFSNRLSKAKNRHIR